MYTKEGLEAMTNGYQVKSSDNKVLKFITDHGHEGLISFAWSLAWRMSLIVGGISIFIALITGGLENY